MRKSSTELLDSSWTRAASGLITGQYTKLPYGRFDFAYDYAGRLRSATNTGGQPGYGQSFTYDAAGSIRSKTGIGSYVYPSAGFGVSGGATSWRVPARCLRASPANPLARAAPGPRARRGRRRHR